MGLKLHRMKPFTLETERLLIRPFRRDDAAEVLAFSSHPGQSKVQGTMRTTLKKFMIIDNTGWKNIPVTVYAWYAVIHGKTKKLLF